jgi:hypothetical protein
MHFTDFFNSAQSAVSYATTIAEVILLIRLAWLGLVSEFKIFSVFLVYDAILTAVLSSFDYHTYGYEWLWTLTAPVWTLLLAGASLELMRGLVQPIRGERINRNAAIYGFLIGMTVSVAASMWTHPQGIMRSTVLLTIIARRSILCGCMLAILFQGVVLFIGDAPIMSNWKLHRRVLLTLLIAVVTSLLTLTAQHRQYVDWFNLVQDVTFLGCLCAWMFGFRRMFSDLRLWIGSGVPTNAQLADIVVHGRRLRTAQGVRAADGASTN